MDAFSHPSNFQFNPKPDTMVDDHEDESEFLGILHVYIHHARNIHNICIYNKQDVYAKFSLTCSPDETLSTRIVHEGGKNPDFNENLTIKVTQPDSVLKCEIWVLSRARNYMEDQLLGFTLVPMSQILGRGKVTEDYSLSSTDLFHSPAGTVKLSLKFNASAVVKNPASNNNNSSITSEVVLLDSKVSVAADVSAYSRIEFPDVNVLAENQVLVSEYSRVANPAKFVTFLQLRNSDEERIPSMDDYEMSADCDCGSSENNPASPNESCGPNSSFQSSTGAPRLRGDERNSAESKQASAAAAIFKTQPSKGLTVEIEGEEESAAMQKQIVDMYMRSMQQFTESLANMKLPMEIDSPAAARGGSGDVEVEGKEEEEEEEVVGATRKKKDNQARVFYGSRAFF
ncbi:hypothetical protein MLD38_009507 [Melastoma candidum]|uniref:Uncharacterized protein n=1 Tax=Melastoma candidum TaxID=119954 RepID=A0ACB9RWX1_9MYRT|nr:hypothetical protein MLD38_009507 [Melastoma candidum]